MDIAEKLGTVSKISRKAGLGLFGAMVTAAVATSAQAGEGVDFLVFQDAGQVQVGGIDAGCYLGTTPQPCDDSGFVERVIEGEMELNGSSPGLFGSADAPGYLSVTDSDVGLLPYGDNLDAGDPHSIDIILAPNSPVPGASILYWDGTGPVSWSAVPNNEFMVLDGNNGSGGNLFGNGVLSGIELDSPGSDGFTDSHPDFFLQGQNPGTDPAFGFYAIFGRSNVGDLVASNAWSIVFDFGVENETAHEAAAESVASFIPEPGTALLVGMGLFGLARSGRKS